MKVIVNKETCIGCGLCESTCPDVFEMVDNIAVPKIQEVPAKDQECAKKMVNECPVNAIEIK